MSKTETDAQPFFNSEDNDTEQKPMQIEVRKATKFYGPPIKNAYRIQSKPRGGALIINNEFKGSPIHKERKGSAVDVDNLKNLFAQLDLETHIKTNLGYGEMRRALREFSDLDIHKNADMCFVCILSHGKETAKIVANDGNPIGVEEILEKFNSYECPSLMGKPKVFLFGACRGNDPADRGVPIPMILQAHEELAPMSSRSTTRSFSPGATRPPTVPTTEDMIIAYPTLPDQVSFRDISRGTWFVESFCQVVMEHAADTPLQDILNERLTQHMRSKKTERGEHQTAEISMRNFSKKLYLNPGIQPGEAENTGKELLILNPPTGTQEDTTGEDVPMLKPSTRAEEDILTEKKELQIGQDGTTWKCCLCTITIPPFCK